MYNGSTIIVDWYTYILCNIYNIIRVSGTREYLNSNTVHIKATIILSKGISLNTYSIYLVFGFHLFGLDL